MRSSFSSLLRRKNGSSSPRRFRRTCVVRADRNRLRQVLVNLLDNAIKYSAPGGRVEISAEPRGDEWVITVRDTGTGIPDEEIPRIWERLYRGDKSRSQRGLGLGLSLVRAIINAHGGSIEVQSTVGKGSSFSIHLAKTTSSASVS